MVNKDTIFRLVIPEWVNKVPIGTIPAQYYKKGTKVPAKLKGGKTKKFGRSSYYVDKKGKKIVKNVKTVGKKKYWNLNGQQFYSTNMHWSTRTAIKSFYRTYFNSYIKKQFKSPFPVYLSHSIEMNITIYEVFSSRTPDITNMWILAKILEDCMVETKILKDDSPQYRRRTSFEYKFVKEPEERNLVIEFKYNKI